MERDIETSPEFSRGFFLAAQDGQEDLAKELLLRLARFSIVVIYEESGGMLILAVPVHAKPEALHIQPSWTGWTAPVGLPGDVSGRMACIKVGGARHRNRLDSNLQRPLIGALAQHKLDLDLDKLTGRIDAIGGVTKAIDRKSRVKRPFDLRVRERIDTFLEEELKKPEFLPLVPYMQQSRAIYLARKEEQLALIDEASTDGALHPRSKAVTKLCEEVAKLKEKQEKDLAAAEQVRTTEAFQRVALEARLASAEASNAELLAKVATLEKARSAANDAHRRALGAEVTARTVAEGQLAAMTAENRGLVARVTAAEGALAVLRLDFEALEEAGAGFAADLAKLVSQVRCEVPDAETGARPYLRVAVSTALPFLPRDLYDFEALNMDVDRLAMDPALVVYAEFVGTNEAKEFVDHYNERCRLATKASVEPMQALPHLVSNAR
jgi:hypothetical protein